ncbi:MAG: hypothetical protein ACRER5_03080 [Pseudomonas sp.]
MRVTTTQLLSNALANLLQVAMYPDNACDNERGEFWATTTQAEDLVKFSGATTEEDHERLLELAGTVRNLRKWTVWNDDRVESERQEIERVAALADAALAQFDLCPLTLHAHYATQIERDGESFNVLALSTYDEKTYEHTGRPGELLAFVPSDSVCGFELAARITKAASMPLYGNGQQVGDALRSAKALIEALVAGETRSEGDMRDVLANFEGLLL